MQLYRSCDQRPWTLLFSVYVVLWLFGALAPVRRATGAPHPRLDGASAVHRSAAHGNCQFGAGEIIVVTDQTMLQTGYGLLPRCTRRR